MKEFGPFTLDPGNECLWRAGARIFLPPKPFAVLRYLVEHPGRLVTHDELLDALWPDTFVQPQILRTYMLDLRRILDDDPRCPKFIQSLPKRGYCFVAAVREVGHASAASMDAPPVPDQPPPPVIGRDHELLALQACLPRAEAGTRQVVFITGEAGIGKTHLVEAFARQSECTPSVLVAVGRCVPGFQAQPYYPLLDALRQLSVAALPNPSPDNPAADTAAHPAPGDLCAVIEASAHDRLVVLILEDLQWADEPTLNVLSALARRHGNARLLIVATIAPLLSSAATSVERLVHDLRLRHLCSELALHRLPRPAIGQLVRQRLQCDSLPDSLHEIVFQHSEGNPRFALALLDHLIAEGLLIRSGSEWQLLSPEHAESAAPADLTHAIELDIERLDSHEQQLLEAGSLAPVAFPAWLVAAALDQDPAQVEEACDRLARRLPFLKRAGEEELPDGTRSSFYVFAHALYRDVLYQRQSPGRRAARHARVAQRLIAMFPGREDLVARDAFVHYEAAGDWTSAIDMLRLATQRALATRAFSEAAELEQHAARIRASIGADRQAPADPPHDLIPFSFAHPSRLRPPSPKA